MGCGLGNVAANCIHNHAQVRHRELGIRETRQLLLQIVAPDNSRVVIHIEHTRRSVELCHHLIPRQRLEVVDIEPACLQLFFRVRRDQLVVQFSGNRHFCSHNQSRVKGRERRRKRTVLIKVE